MILFILSTALWAGCSSRGGVGRPLLGPLAVQTPALESVLKPVWGGGGRMHVMFDDIHSWGNFVLQLSLVCQLLLQCGADVEKGPVFLLVTFRHRKQNKII